MGTIAFKFGDRVKAVFASKQNPHRCGIFVRANWDWCEVTDGNGRFWKTSTRSTVSESMPDEDADHLANQLWLAEHRTTADADVVARVANQVQAYLARRAAESENIGKPLEK